MWKLMIFLNLVALHRTVSATPPSPINVTFSSVNLRNILQWHPGKSTPDDTHFTVQYAIYGDSVEDSKGRRLRWRPVHGCTEIKRCWCILSNETWDLEHGYYGRVRAVSRRVSSKWALTSRFDPKLDSTFGPPTVSVDIEENTAMISLKGPMRFQPNNQTPVVSMATVYPQMMYNLTVRNTRRGQTSHFLVASNLYKYRLMEYDTEYCFTAKTKFLSMPIQCQSSEWHCIITPPDPTVGQLRRIVVGIVIPAVCICVLVVAGYLLHHYVTGKGQKGPNELILPSFHLPPLMFPPEKLSIILITDIKPSNNEGAASEPPCSREQPHIPPPPYIPQGSDTPSQLEEPLDDEPIDYGCVVKEDRNKTHDGIQGLNDDSAGGCAPRTKSIHLQVSTHTNSQTHPPIHPQSEMSTLTGMNECSQVNLVPLTQTLAPLLPFQRAAVDQADRAFPDLSLDKTQGTDSTHIPLNLQTEEAAGIREDMDRTVRTGRKTDGAVEDGGQGERVPLLSAYASQNINNMSTSCTDQSDSLPDDYGVLGPATVHEIVNDEGEVGEEEEEGGTVCIDWDPMTRKLVLPDFAMELNKEAGSDGLVQPEERRENRMQGEEERGGVNVMKGRLTLENVFVRQASEEEAEAQRKLERGGDEQLEEDSILSKWNLVFSADQ